MQTKSALTSTTIWGLIIATFLQRKGYVISDELQGEAVNWITGAAQVIAALMVLIGRWRATKPLSLSGGVKYAVILLSVGLIGSTSVGCAVTPPGQDPVIVNTQSTIKTLYDTVHLFAQLDNDNREFMKANFPQVHAAAESLRKRDPATGKAAAEKAFDDAWAALDAYRAVGSSAGSDLQAKLMVIGRLADMARNYLIQTQSKVPKPPAAKPAAASFNSGERDGTINSGVASGQQVVWLWRGRADRVGHAAERSVDGRAGEAGARSDGGRIQERARVAA
jgi:hypothetical protein